MGIAATDLNSSEHSKALSPLAAAGIAFRQPTAGGEPLRLDCRPFRGLPDRALALPELRDRLMRRVVPRPSRDAVWRTLVHRSRTEGACWTQACVGMALPALASSCQWLEARYPGEAHEVQAEVIAGFLAALSAVDLERPGVMARLRWAAHRSGMAALWEALDAPVPVGLSFRSAPPPAPCGHPDLVLARAVRAGVLTETEADLIGDTRLDDESLADWAAAHDWSVAAAYKARRRSEWRLVDFLCNGTVGESRRRSADAQGVQARPGFRPSLV